MTELLYLIGPSRLGKTSAGRYVVSVLDDAVLIDLDAKLKPHRPPDLDPVLTAQNLAARLTAARGVRKS